MLLVKGMEKVGEFYVYIFVCLLLVKGGRFGVDVCPNKRSAANWADNGLGVADLNID